MQKSRIPTFALNKLVKIRYFLVLAQNLSLEMRYSKTFKNDYFLHLMTQLLGIHNFFPKSYQIGQKLIFRTPGCPYYMDVQPDDFTHYLITLSLDDHFCIL